MHEIERKLTRPSALQFMTSPRQIAHHVKALSSMEVVQTLP
jgi:hypothetical protein